MRVSAVLPFQGRPIAVELRMRRRWLKSLQASRNREPHAPSEALDAEASRLTSRLVDTANLSTCLPAVSLDRLMVASRSGTRIVIGREDLLKLSTVAESAEGYRRLRFEMRARLLPGELVQWADGLPRGRSQRSWPLTRVLPFAFLAAQLLREHAEGDRRVHTKIREILDEDNDTQVYLAHFQDDPASTQQLAFIVALVDRAFRGAWERYGVTRPCLPGDPQDPREALRTYFYGKTSKPHRRALALVKRQDPAWRGTLISIAQQLLLGNAGDGARTYALLASSDGPRISPSRS